MYPWALSIFGESIPPSTMESLRHTSQDTEVKGKTWSVHMELFSDHSKVSFLYLRSGAPETGFSIACTVVSYVQIFKCVFLLSTWSLTLGSSRHGDDYRSMCWFRLSWIWILTLELRSCVILCKWLCLSLIFPYEKMRIILRLRRHGECCLLCAHSTLD